MEHLVLFILPVTLAGAEIDQRPRGDTRRIGDNDSFACIQSSQTLCAKDTIIHVALMES